MQGVFLVQIVAGVAQSVEQLPCKQLVAGSIPVASSGGLWISDRGSTEMMPGTRPTFGDITQWESAGFASRKLRVQPPLSPLCRRASSLPALRLLTSKSVQFGPRETPCSTTCASLRVRQNSKGSKPWSTNRTPLAGGNRREFSSGAHVFHWGVDKWKVTGFWFPHSKVRILPPQHRERSSVGRASDF